MYPLCASIVKCGLSARGVDGTGVLVYPLTLNGVPDGYVSLTSDVWACCVMSWFDIYWHVLPLYDLAYVALGLFSPGLL